MGDIEEKIKEAETTRKLDLSNSRLSDDLPEEIFKLPNLISINLYRNQLISIPEALWDLTNLTEINLYRNRLQNIPIGISNLPSLKILNLGSNKFTTIPLEIFEVSSLEELDLSNNQLTELPTDICNLNHLRDLKLFRNRISVLPPELGLVKTLKKLDLNHNLLSSLPPMMGKLTSLILLDVTDNPLSSPPISICNRGSMAILKYLRDQMEAITNAAHCIAEGKGIEKAQAGEESSFVIYAKNSNDDDRNEGGDEFQVTLDGASSIVAQVEDKNDGTYFVTYTANVSGSYSLHVTLNEEHISGSPFILQVETGPVYPPTCIATGVGLTGCIPGIPANFTIESRDKLGNPVNAEGLQFEVKLTGPEEIAGKVTDTGNGTYDVTWTAKAPGTYSLSVTLGGEHISGSPFSSSVLSTASADSNEESKRIKEELIKETKLRASMEERAQKLERKVAKLKKKNKRKKLNIQKYQVENQKLSNEIQNLREEMEGIKKQKEQLEQETKMTKEIKEWKKTLESNFEETKKKLEQEAQTRAVLERVLKQMQVELDEEVKARTQLEDLRRSLEEEASDLQEKLRELEDLKKTLEEETTARDEWKQQLEIEYKKIEDSINKEKEQGKLLQLKQELEDLKLDLEEEAKARLDLDSSKKLLVGETEELKLMLGEVEESRNQLDLETRVAQEMDLWKSKLEAQGRAFLNIEHEKWKIEEESASLQHRLKKERSQRKILRSKLAAQKSKEGTSEDEVRKMEKMIDEETKKSAELEKAKELLEKKLSELNNPEAESREKEEADSTQNTKAEEPLTPRARSSSIDPTKLSFKEKLAFWSNFKTAGNAGSSAKDKGSQKKNRPKTFHPILVNQQ